MRTVQCSTSDQPWIAAPYLQNKNLNQCKCNTSVWHLTREPSLAVALNMQIYFDYLVEVTKKTISSRKTKGFTKAVKTDVTIKEKGL